MSERSDDVTDVRDMERLAVRWSQQAFEWEGRKANPIYRGMREREGAVHPGPPRPMDDDVLEFDTAIAHSHPAVYAFLYLWYCEGGSIEQKGERIGLSRTAMYEHHRWYLAYVRGQIDATRRAKAILKAMGQHRQVANLDRPYVRTI